MNHKFQAALIPWRFYLIVSIILLASLGLFSRVVSLTVVERNFLLQQGNERVLRKINIPAFRGMIVDRNNFPLAVSTRVYAVWMNPQLFNPNQENCLALSQLLNIDSDKIKNQATENRLKNREFMYLKRAISPQAAETIRALDIPGIDVEPAYKRFYPEGEVTAHIIGFTNVDDQGQEGLELAYNNWLSGVTGKKWVMKDRMGRVISDVQSVQDQKPGHSLKLSIDRRIQYFAYQALMSGVTENKATSGSAIVLDVKTGEVLAMVNYPSFNPNKRPNKIDSRVRNRATTDTFEPGSTIKAFSIASALDSGRYQLNSIIDTSPGWMVVDKNLVHDEKNNGPLSLTQIMQISSNMGVTKMILSLPPDQLWSLLHRVGFGEITGIGFPGEESGSLIKRAPWGRFTLATLAFGYGLAVTPLQLAKAYAVLANGGIKVPVTLLYQEQSPTGTRVIAEHVAKEMLMLLESVVAKDGTGAAARISHYRVAGKTGTTKMVGKGGYQAHRYESSFVGIAPVSDPRLVVAVVIHDPRGQKYYGGPVAGPVFKTIMQESLRILAVPPDGDEANGKDLS